MQGRRAPRRSPRPSGLKPTSGPDWPARASGGSARAPCGTLHECFWRTRGGRRATASSGARGGGPHFHLPSVHLLSIGPLLSRIRIAILIGQLFRITQAAPVLIADNVVEP